MKTHLIEAVHELKAEEGLSNKEIGEKLFIGIKTVKTHVSNILAKLEVEDRPRQLFMQPSMGWINKDEILDDILEEYYA